MTVHRTSSRDTEDRGLLPRFNLATFVTTWLFLRDLRAAIAWLDHLDSAMPHEHRPNNFHH